MKVQTAQIQAVILPNKRRPDGTCPVAIRVNFHGRAMRTLPVSVLEKDWDSRTANVRKSDPEHAAKNQIIADGLHRADQNRLALEAAGKAYAAKDVLSEPDRRQGPQLLGLGEICGRICSERGLRYSTVKSYGTALAKLREYYGDGVGLLDVDSDNIAGFGKWMVSRGYKNGYVHTVMYRLASIWKYAVGHGVIPEDGNPFKTFHYTRLYKSKTRKDAISEAELARIEGWYAQHFTVDDSGAVAPASDEVWRDLTTLSTRLCSVAMFLASYYLQGLSAVDMALLKRGQFSLRKTTVKHEEMRAVQVVVDGVEQTAYIPSSSDSDVWYWEVDGVKRRKTGQPVAIAVEMNYMTLAVIGLYLETSDARGGYVFPFTDRAPDDRTLHRIMNRFSLSSQRHLRGLARELQLGSDVTMYTARHSFASHLVRNGATAGLLASAMGRNVEGIDSYIHSIGDHERLLAAKRR